MHAPSLFPPPPRGLKGRARELETLAQSITATKPTRLALVGAGGSGKSMLACALGHRLSTTFEGRIHWFRVGAWDYYTLVEMLALRFGTGRERDTLVPALHRYLRDGGERFVVLDNHEDDRAMARILETFADTPVTFVITARRCLLAGVLVYPVTAPLVTSGQNAFPRVAALTRPLRWNPLALDIADAIVGSGEITVAALAAYLDVKGVRRVHTIDHEDDLPEVALQVAWAWGRLDKASHRVLAVLAHVEGDNVDLASLATLAELRGDPMRALAPLLAWHLVQEPIRGRYALHAVVRHAVLRRTSLAPDKVFEHYVTMLETHPERLVLEQTHLFAAMDHAHRTGNLTAMLRIEELLRQLDEPLKEPAKRVKSVKPTKPARPAKPVKRGRASTAPTPRRR